jgi:hypothetical protein
VATTPTPVSDPRNATIASGKRAITFNTDSVQPPTPLLIYDEDQLLLKVTAPTIALPFTVNFELRILRPDGAIIPMRIPVVANATTVQFNTRLTTGYILSITASLVGAATAGRGQVFVQAFIARNIATDIEIGWVLISDYLTTNARPTWPGNQFRSPLEGPGFIYGFNVANPAAGNDFTQIIPALVRWRLKSIYALFTASAVAANRFPNWNLTLLTGGLYRGQAIAAVLASTNSLIIGIAGATYTPPAEFQLIQYIPIPPDLIMPAGSVISSFTPNKDVGDTWTNITLNIEEWIDI